MTDPKFDYHEITLGTSCFVVRTTEETTGLMLKGFGKIWNASPGDAWEEGNLSALTPRWVLVNRPLKFRPECIQFAIELSPEDVDNLLNPETYGTELDLEEVDLA